MKNTLYWWLLLLSMTFVAACSDGGEDVVEPDPKPTPSKPAITLDVSSADFTTDGGSNTISFTTAAPWTAEVLNSRADAWCSVSPTSGPAGDAEITVTTTANDTPDNRSASIVLKAGTTEKTITVSQKQKDALTVTSDKFEVSAEGGEVTIEVKANIDFEYTISEKAKVWIASADSRALKTTTLVFNVSANEDTEKREGSITITSGSFKETVTVYQEGTVPVITLTQNEFVVPSAGDVIAVEVKSNVDVEVELPAETDWLSEDKSRAMSTNTYYFIVAESGEYEQREAEIKFTNKKNELSETVKVVQVQKDAIVVAKNEYEMDVEGGALDFEILTNVDVTVSIPDSVADWISHVESRALESKTLHFDIAPCQSDERIGIITLTGGDAMQTITIKQNGKKEINPEDIPDNEIWYRTSTGRKLSTNADICNANLVSNTYSYGVGVLKFENTILTINSEAFTDNTLIELYVPDCVERLSAAFLRDSRLKSFRVPKELKYAQGKNECGPFENNTELTILTGHHVSEDGKCLVIGTELADFVGIDLTEYTTPHDVTIIREYAFSENNTLEKIIISEGVQIIEDHAFLCNTVSNRLKEVSLPKSLKQIGAHVFLGCNKIELFSGECDLVSNDGYSIIIDNYYQGLKGLIKYASGSSITSYNIPDGVGFLETNAFDSANNLTHIYFPSSVVLFNGQPFENSYNIQTLSGSNILIDNKSLVVDNVLLYVAPKGLNQYRTPQGVTYIGYGALADKPELEEVVISDEVIAVGSLASCRPYEIPLGYILQDNPNLKTVTISANMRILGMDPFGSGGNGGLNDSKNIETVYLRAPIPPVIGHNFPDKILTLFPNLTIYVPEQSLQAYLGSPDWAPYRGYIKGYNYTDLPENDTYISSDYSQDGTITTLQTATQGNGIDIVLMGDGYSDRQIADGTYQTDMENLYKNFFTEEPYKSFKDHFNVYYVNVVSATEGYEYGNTALDGYFGEGTLAGGNDNSVFTYAQKAISTERMDEALLIVAMNSDNYAGTCYMYQPTSGGDYGSGPSVSYFPKGGDATTFAQLLHHEACGHGFAKLADEYAYEEYGTISVDEINAIKEQQNYWGWWKNVDFTNDLSQIRWSKFINDSRYANEGLGAYEGGLTYWTGVWRPTENSIMRYNTGGFNAPSREAIYYRIHKLAYGADWQYDYEKFVEWDAINRNSTTARSLNHVEVPKKFKPLHAPVVKRQTWKDAK